MSFLCKADLMRCMTLCMCSCHLNCPKVAVLRAVSFSGGVYLGKLQGLQWCQRQSGFLRMPFLTEGGEQRTSHQFTSSADHTHTMKQFYFLSMLSSLTALYNTAVKVKELRLHYAMQHILKFLSVSIPLWQPPKDKWSEKVVQFFQNQALQGKRSNILCSCGWFE